MRGKVSFNVKEEEEEEEEESLARVINRPVTANVLFLKNTRSSNKPIRGITTTSSSTQKVPALPLTKVRDFDFTASPDIIMTDEPYCQDDTFIDYEMQRKVEEARRVRKARAQEGLLDDYISLETTTQRQLDEEDINLMIRQDSGRVWKRPKSTLEDPTDGELTTIGEEPPLNHQSSESDQNYSKDGDDSKFFDDGLDGETFEEYNQANGRIRMMTINEKADMIDRLALKEVDFDDEETKEWELQQIRKGFSAGIPFTREARKASKVLIKNLSKLETTTSKESISITLIPTILEKINKESSKLSHSIEIAKANLTQVELHLVESRKVTDELVSSAMLAKERQDFYTQILEYISSFGEMVEEVMLSIEKLELEWTSILRERKEDLIPPKRFDMESFKSKVEMIEGRKALIFDNVEVEYADPVNFLRRIQEWREAFPESYEQCFVDLCLPSFLEIFIRLELVGWDPLLSSTNLYETFAKMVNSSFGGMTSCPEVENKMLTLFFIPGLVKLIRASFQPLNSDLCDAVTGISRELKLLLSSDSRLLTVHTLYISGLGF